MRRFQYALIGSVLGDYTVLTAAANLTPGGTSGNSNVVGTLVSHAAISTLKSVDRASANLGDTLTHTLTLTNSGNVTANNIVLTDPVPTGTTYVAGSLGASVSFTGSPLTTIHLTQPMAAGETVSLTYQVLVTAIPNPNPIPNTAKAAFTYTVNALDPNGVNGSATSNTVNTVVFRNNYEQQVSDLIHSIALEEAEIADIANAEGAKIQQIFALNATFNELLCINKSVSDTLEALATLESVLKQKLSAVDCQISPSCME